MVSTNYPGLGGGDGRDRVEGVAIFGVTSAGGTVGRKHERQD